MKILSFQLPGTNDSKVAMRLLLSLAVAVVLAIGFVLIALLVRENLSASFDKSVLGFFHNQASDGFSQAAIVLTQFGGEIFVPLVTILLAVFLWFVYGKNYAALLASAVGGASIIMLVLKLVFARPRPDVWLWIESSFSFPSGHATASMALAAGLVAVLWFTRWRTFAIVGGMIYILIIGLTRIYLGVHYPTDIFAGWLVGLAWVVIVSAIFARSPRALPKKPKKN